MSHRRREIESNDIVLVTCRTWPELSASDAELARELTTRGHRVRSHPWNAAPTTDVTSADLVVLRSNWDYHHDLAGFDRWLTLIEDSGVTLRNSAGLVRSHLHKSYLERLAATGYRTPATMVTADFDLDAILGWATDHDLDRVVVKPAWGASGEGVELVRAADLRDAARRWRSNPDRRPMLVQEFVAGVSDGEISLVFFAGTFSHALVRMPAADDFRVNGQYGGTMSLFDRVDPDVVRFGAEVVASLPEPATYARIDVVSDGVDHVVMEVEVNEPALGLHLAPGAAARFADALVG